MDIEEFVKNTLEQVASGIAKANEKEETQRRFGSSGGANIGTKLSGVMQDNSGNLYTTVDFDVAVTVTKEGGAGAKLKIPYVEFEGSGKGGNETVSRVKFSVPLRFSI